jgi:hypothetical protein
MIRVPRSTVCPFHNGLTTAVVIHRLRMGAPSICPFPLNPRNCDIVGFRKSEPRFALAARLPFGCALVRSNRIDIPRGSVHGETAGYYALPVMYGLRAQILSTAFPERVHISAHVVYAVLSHKALDSFVECTSGFVGGKSLSVTLKLDLKRLIEHLRSVRTTGLSKKPSIKLRSRAGPVPPTTFTASSSDMAQR